MWTRAFKAHSRGGIADVAVVLLEACSNVGFVGGLFFSAYSLLDK